MRNKRNFIFAIIMSTSIIISSFIIFYFPIQTVDESKESKKESVTPKGVRLTLIHNPNESIVISWYTEDEAEDPEIEYSTDDDLSDSEVFEPEVEKIDYHSYEASDSILFVSCYVYTVELTDLRPDTTYYYRISSDDENRGETMNFKTFPNIIDELKIIVLSDLQEYYFHNNPKFFLKILEDEEFDFLISLGDNVNDGTQQIEWNKYFRKMESIHAYKPCFFVEGNHDGKDSLLMYDNIPMIDSSYSYYFSNLLFLLGLNTQTERKSSEDFINSSLKNANETNVKWKISIFHKHIYNTRVGRHDRNVEWTEYFMNYSVDMIMYGHNAFYERQYVNNSYYILCPPFGDYKKESDDFERREFTQVIESIFGFMKIKISQTDFTLETWGYEDDFNDFRKYDNITITK